MAPITRAAAVVNYSSGRSRFIPELWHGEIIEKFYPATCLHKIASTTYEGTISGKGDTVIIRTGPDIAWTDGEIGEELTYVRPDSTALELYINKLKRFGVIVDDVDKIQSDLKLLAMWTQDAAEQKKIVIEKDIFADIYTEAGHAGPDQGANGDIDLGETAAPREITSTNIIDFILDLGQLKDENNVPESQRWTVLPPWAMRLIKSSDLKDASLAGDGTSMLRNGRVGMIDRETLYMSNNLSTVTDTTKCTHIISGHPKGFTFASQIDNMKSGVSEVYDGEWIRGKVVYGRKVVKPETFIHGYITKG
jgi:hypothetical protein